MRITKAILLVGGEGTRLRPLTLTTPKPMLPVAGYPITAHQIAKLADAGITEVMLATSYRAEVFDNWLANQDYLTIEIRVAVEQTPLGTGGAIRNAADQLGLEVGESVVVLNGDVLSGHNLKAQIDQYAASNAAGSLHLVSVPDPSAFGLVPTDASGRVTEFLEKPKTPAEIVTDQINAGCYILSFELVQRIAPGVPASVEREVFPAALADGVTMLGYLDNSYFLDLGTPFSYIQGSADLVQQIVPSPLIKSKSEAIIHPSAKIDPTAIIFGGSVISADAVIEAGAVVSGSIVFDSARVGAGAQLFDSILGAKSHLVEDLALTRVVISEHCQIEVEIPPGTRVWPDLALSAN
ncbi:MAG: NTP transferase domain-containing protein [Actinobacteria bacterium]|jgi:mannose-1-phosphate guanylyltransferase|uniref:Unannotated protein n=1 Tax=freshwater metagenome TaxID=449393 RepID=A0A6J6E1T4_9ZZZZ|nr:NTP transferase domain-containing protein [Actinomycetota bacterium]